MKVSSVFEGVVRNEDSYTNLLRNLMCADEDYCRAICLLLQPKNFNLDLTVPPRVRTQVPLAASAENKHGRADMLIECQSAVLLVEVKIDWYCGLTEYQDFRIDDQGNSSPKSYIEYLEGRRRMGQSVGLCVLAPRRWMHRLKTNALLETISRVKFGAGLQTWENLSAATSSGNFSGFVREFGSFLEKDFMDIRFDSNESSLLISPDGLSRFGSTLLKLQELIRQSVRELKAELARRDDECWEVKDLWGDATEYGAAIYRGGERVLWFGIWAEAKWPLVLGLDENRSPEGLDLGGLEQLPGLIDDWRVYKLPDNCFTGGEPLLNLVSTLSAILTV